MNALGLSYIQSGVSCKTQILYINSWCNYSDNSQIYTDFRTNGDTNSRILIDKSTRKDVSGNNLDTSISLKYDANSLLFIDCTWEMVYGLTSQRWFETETKSIMLAPRGSAFWTAADLLDADMFYVDANIERYGPVNFRWDIHQNLAPWVFPSHLLAYGLLQPSTSAQFKWGQSFYTFISIYEFDISD